LKPKLRTGQRGTFLLRRFRRIFGVELLILAIEPVRKVCE